MVQAPASWLKGHGFKSLQERWENFLLQGQLSVLTLILVYVPPSSYCSSMQKILVNLPKVQVASYSLHIMYVALHWQTAAVSCGNSHASAVSTPLRWTFKNVLQKAIHSCRITRKRSESVWGSRTALYKKRSTNSALESKCSCSVPLAPLSLSCYARANHIKLTSSR